TASFARAVPNALTEPEMRSRRTSDVTTGMAPSACVDPWDAEPVLARAPPPGLATSRDSPAVRPGAGSPPRELYSAHAVARTATLKLTVTAMLRGSAMGESKHAKADRVSHRCAAKRKQAQDCAACTREAPSVRTASASHASIARFRSSPQR